MSNPNTPNLYEYHAYAYTFRLDREREAQQRRLAAIARGREHSWWQNLSFLIQIIIRRLTGEKLKNDKKKRG